MGGKLLPTEAKWEFAARGGVQDLEFAWGTELAPGDEIMANTWFGNFPFQNRKSHGFDRTSPVASFPANQFGLYDMIGNVWEWTSDRFALPEIDTRVRCCTGATSSIGDKKDVFPESAGTHRVLKGGSHLCAPNYCQRYRLAARYPQSIDTSTSDIGFRCIKR